MDWIRCSLAFSLLLGSIPLFTQIDCSNSSVGLIPLTDMGEETFMGYEGGLYPGGSNERPLEHTIPGVLLANGIKPLDTAGNTDWENGVIVMAGMGASTSGSTFGKMKELLAGSDSINECLSFVQLTFGGKGLESMIPGGSATYWSLLIDSIMVPKGITPNQVQIAWIKSASKDDTINEFPLQADSIYEKYVRVINRMKDVFPNLRLLYVSSHAYGGYAGELSDNVKLVGEPAAYYGGFSVKWLVEAQINGDERLNYEGAFANAPWISWAPYYWADGENLREYDGLNWECEDYAEDGGGFHHTESGKIKEAEMLIDFFYNDPTSEKWFRSDFECQPGQQTSLEAGSVGGVSVYPNPNQGTFVIELPEPGQYQLRLMDSRGSVVLSRHFDVANGQLQLTLQESLSPGIYLLQIQSGDRVASETLVIH